MKVLVTGGAGFIGSHVVERLVREGHQVRVFDNLSTGKQQNLAAVQRDVEFVLGDVRDPAALRGAVGRCDVVYHLAAVVSVQRSVEQPGETLGINLGGTLEVLRAAQGQGTRRVVLASSAAVYGAGDTGPKLESMPTLPQSPYGLEKLASEHYLRIWHELYGLETVSLRYFNVFGPRQDPSSPYSGVTSIFADRLARGARPTIFGDGEQTRDLVFVSNIVDANLRAGFGEIRHGTFNVGCGVATSLNQLLSVMGEVWEADLPPIYAEARAGDIRHSLADISRARAELGYVPAVSVREGLMRLRASL